MRSLYKKRVEQPIGCYTSFGEPLVYDKVLYHVGLNKNKCWSIEELRVECTFAIGHVYYVEFQEAPTLRMAHHTIDKGCEWYVRRPWSLRKKDRFMEDRSAAVKCIRPDYDSAGWIFTDRNEALLKIKRCVETIEEKLEMQLSHLADCKVHYDALRGIGVHSNNDKMQYEL